MPLAMFALHLDFYRNHHFLGWIPNTAVQEGTYGLAFTMGKLFLTDNSAKVGQILMIFSAAPQEISYPIKWWNNQPSSTSASACARTLHYAHDGFWPIFAQKCFGFCDGKFFPVMGNSWNFQGSISTARGTFEPKAPPTSPYNPFFWPKTSF